MVITEEYFCIIFEIVGPWIFFTWIYNVLLRLSFQRPLNQRRMNHGYSTMSDGILNGIFLIVHRNFLLSHLEAAGSWIFFCACVQSMLTWSGCRAASRRMFLLNDYYSVAMSFETKLIFWRRKCYTIRLDSFLYLSSFTTTIKNDRLLVQLVLNGLR